MSITKTWKAALGLTLGLALLPQATQAGIPKGGLGAITVSHDGNTVYAAGDNRVLYVLDAKDLSIKKRVWIELNPYELILSKDGKTLVLHDSSGQLTFMDAETMKPTKTVSKAEIIAIAHDAETIVAADRGRGKGEKASTTYATYDIASGKQIMKGTIKANVGTIGITPDASKVFAMSNYIKTDKEPKEKAPKEMKGLEKDTFRQQHDQRESQVITLDAEGKETGRFTTWAVAGSYSAMKPTADGLMVVNSSNRNLKMSFDGSDVSLFKTEAFGHYGYTYSKDGGMLISGGLRKGAITNFTNGESLPFEVKRIGGWPEYFEGFAIGPKGFIYGGTSAYRLMKLSPQGQVEAEVPVF